ncbi:hypothetical protein [Loktanella fryxellensis]|uniref:hypothetical protein n=1 Tax=Loktanella fryxellensis TaxID=245187 RepID=UPI000B7D1FA1|nr:hypothetical protein [Loktanella fryxellensis]
MDEAAAAAAKAPGMCEFGVATAVLTADAQITGTCLTTAATAVVPLIGGLGPAVAIAAVAAVAAVAAGGGAANSTSN